MAVINSDSVKGEEDVVASVYRAVLTNEPIRMASLPSRVSLPATEIEAALATLKTLQLVHQSPDPPNYVTAASPLTAELLAVEPLESELRDLRARLHRLRSWLEPLRQVYAEVAAARGTSDALKNLSSPAEIAEALDSVARSCTKEVLAIQPGGPRPEEVLTAAMPRDTAMLARGVRMRTIYQHSARFSRPTQSYVERVSAAGGEVRTAEELPRRLLIFDRVTAFIPSAENDNEAFMVRQPSTVAYLLDVFEKAWDAALPFTSADDSRGGGLLSSMMEMSVARLMLVERKDGAIARRLGISERTCRSHIARIMRRVGARNRTHLGYLLATGGLRMLASAAGNAPDVPDAPG